VVSYYGFDNQDLKKIKEK
jgi:hypothetical protein